MSRIAVLIGLALAALPLAAQAEPFEGAYRGSFVCEKMKNAPDILRAPFDMIITGKSAVFARPIFNRFGTRVIGNELAAGTIDDDGALTLTSKWSAGAFSFAGAYGGSIRGHVGTLIGTQTWKGPGGEESRGCTVAFVHLS